MDQGSQNPTQNTGAVPPVQQNKEPQVVPSTAPSMEPEQAPQPQDTVVGKTDATTYAVGSQVSEDTPAQEAPAEHESVADKLFAPFKKLMDSGKAPANVAPEKPEPLAGDQPHVATPDPDTQPQN